METAAHERPYPRLRILHVFRAPLGGLFRNVIDLANGQLARGHQVGIFCDSSTGGARADQVLGELAPRLALGVMRAPMSRYPSRTDLMAQIAFVRHRKAMEPDVVHCHGSKGGLYGRLPARFDAERTYVTAYTPHGGSFNYKPGTLEHRLYMAVERLLEPATDMFTFESRYIHERFRAYVGHEPVTDHRIVLNGVADAEFEPIIHGSDTPFDLVYLGELRSAKGIDTLIEAMGLLKSRGLTPGLLIVGSGPDEAQLKALATRHQVSTQITWQPPSPIRGALAQGRIMVVPSRAESLPYVILEAAAAAQPLVSTNVGGIPEIYGPTHAHRLIEPNSAGALADAIALALAMPQDALSAQARDLAGFVRQHFTLDQMIENALAGYRAALGSRRAAGGNSRTRQATA
jgi:glycosyltransferase involved in cell wall biosynthesis